MENHVDYNSGISQSYLLMLNRFKAEIQYRFDSCTARIFEYLLF
jgi:hypothetical protein